MARPLPLELRQLLECEQLQEIARLWKERYRVSPSMPDWDGLISELFEETYEIDTDEDDEEIGADWDENAQWDLDDDEEDEGEDSEDAC